MSSHGRAGCFGLNHRPSPTMDADSSVIDIDEDESLSRASRRGKVFRASKIFFSTCFVITAYVALHELGHATACASSRGFHLDQVEVLNVRLYPSIGWGEGWSKLSTRLGATTCTMAFDASLKTYGVILMSGFLLTTSIQILALVSATCRLLPYGLYFIFPDWVYYALTGEFQEGVSLTRPNQLLVLKEPDDPATQWTSLNTAVAMIIMSLGSVFLAMQVRQLLKS